MLLGVASDDFPTDVQRQAHSLCDALPRLRAAHVGISLDMSYPRSDSHEHHVLMAPTLSQWPTSGAAEAPSPREAFHSHVMSGKRRLTVALTTTDTCLFVANETIFRVEMDDIALGHVEHSFGAPGGRAVCS